MDKLRKKQLISIFLLFIIVFALGNLIYNIEHLDTGEENFFQANNGPDSGSDYVSVSESFSTNLRLVLTGFMGFGIVLVIISIAYTAAKKDKAALKSSIVALMGGLLVIAIIGGFVYLGEERSTPLDYNPLLNQNVTDAGGGNSSGMPDYAEPEGRNVALGFITLAVVVAFIALIIFGIGDIIKLRSDKTLKPGEEISAGEMAQAIRRTMADLDTATDVRSTILRCYRDMTRMARRHGVREEEHLTPREFRDRMEAKLPISEEHLDGLVMLFEEARYSDHVLPEEFKSRAKALLGEIGEDLTEQEEMITANTGSDGAPENVDIAQKPEVKDGSQ